MYRVLVFSRYAGWRGPHSYYVDWVAALRTHPGFTTDVVDTSTPASLAFGLARARRRRYDLVVYPYGFFYETRDSRRRAVLAFAAGLSGTKVFFLENEYRLLREKLACATFVGADYVTSQLPKATADRAYGGIVPPDRIVSLPHGLGVTGEGDAAPPPAAVRSIDLGFRGSSYPFYVGHRERELLVEYFTEHAARLGLRVDIALDAPLDPGGWPAFLRRCRGLLGHEAGTNYLELNDVTRDRIGRYERDHPGAVFDEIERMFFKDYPDPVSGRAVSSRHFDAIGARACQIMFPGRYSDVLVADEHYLALRRDFANVDDVLARFRDEDHRRRMVERTYAYVRDAHTLRHRIDGLLSATGLA